MYESHNRYTNEVAVDKRVYKNVKLFKSRVSFELHGIDTIQVKLFMENKED